MNGPAHGGGSAPPGGEAYAELTPRRRTLVTVALLLTHDVPVRTPRLRWVASPVPASGGHSNGQAFLGGGGRQALVVADEDQ